MLIAKERPGVYWDYDASGVLVGSDSSNRWESPPCVKRANKTGCITIRRISDGKAVFGEDSIMAGMIEKASLTAPPG